MNKAIIMVGEENINGLTNETYQLVIDCNYTSSSYTPRQQEHIEFLDKISEEFAKKIIAEKSSLEVGVLNGFKIDSTSGRPAKINSLKKVLLEYFSMQLKTKLSKMSNGGAMSVISIAETN